MVFVGIPLSTYIRFFFINKSNWIQRSRFGSIPHISPLSSVITRPSYIPAAVSHLYSIHLSLQRTTVGRSGLRLPARFWDYTTPCFSSTQHLLKLQRCFPAERPGRGVGLWLGERPTGCPWTVSLRSSSALDVCLLSTVCVCDVMSAFCRNRRDRTHCAHANVNTWVKSNDSGCCMTVRMEFWFMLNCRSVVFRIIWLRCGMLTEHLSVSPCDKTILIICTVCN